MPVSFAPRVPQAPTFFNIAQPGRDRSRSDEAPQMSGAATASASAPTPPAPPKPTRGRKGPRDDAETPVLSKAKRTASQPQRPLEPETPVLPRGASTETVRYPSRSLSAETPQMQPPRAPKLPIRREPPTPQLARAPTPAPSAPEETPQLPAYARRELAMGGRSKSGVAASLRGVETAGHVRLELGKFLTRYRAQMHAKEARGKRTMALRQMSPPTDEAVEQIEKSFTRSFGDMSPRARRKITIAADAFRARPKR